MTPQADWRLYRGTRIPGDGLDRLPPPPAWRPHRSGGTSLPDGHWLRPAAEGEQDWSPAALIRARRFEAAPEVVNLVNAALYLRRPLLVTGAPGSGKSTLIDAVAHELQMGEPMRWAINSRSSLREALYLYDAVGRLQASQQPGLEGAPADDIGRYISLGPLGTAMLPSRRTRALLIDEIDKADPDLPNDLLNLLDEGEYRIPELARLDAAQAVTVNTCAQGQGRIDISGGLVRSHEYPLIVMTSNGERDFSAPFLRRCLCLNMPNPTGPHETKGYKDWSLLDRIVGQHFGTDELSRAQTLIDAFKTKARQSQTLPTDQLLNAIHLVCHASSECDSDLESLAKRLMNGLEPPDGR